MHRLFISQHIYIKVIAVSCMLSTLIISCEKKDIQFGNNALTEDPNIVTIDTITADIYTFQTDSFSTSNTGFFIAGNHTDSVLGNFQSTAYFDLDAPVDSSKVLQGCTSCYFDSLVLVTQFNGSYYGDTTMPFILNVNQLTQQISTTNGAFGYNIDHYNYYSNPIGTFSGIVHPSEKRKMHIRLSDNIGVDLFTKVKNNDDAIVDNTSFQQYIKGFCFTGDTTADNTVYYFKPEKDSALIHLYYHKNEILPQQYAVTFPLNKSHQFNGLSANRSGTLLTAFTPNKQELIPGAQTGERIFLHANSGLNPRVSFPSIFSIKELNSYIQIVNATLEIYPSKKTYGLHSFYTLPLALNLVVVDNYNTVYGYVTNSSGETLTGDLTTDYIYNENTKYTYNITRFLNTDLARSKYSPLYLSIEPLSNVADSIEQRLILDNTSFKLKLNVLGL